MAISASKRCDRAARGGRRLLFTVLTSFLAACTSEAVIDSSIKAHGNAEMQASEASAADIDRERRLSPRRSFLRQEIVSPLAPASLLEGNVEISSQGHIQSATASSRASGSMHRRDDIKEMPEDDQSNEDLDVNKTNDEKNDSKNKDKVTKVTSGDAEKSDKDKALERDLHKFELKCVNVHQENVEDSAWQCQANGDNPSQPVCADNVAAKQACCICDGGGVRFKFYKDTQCTSGEGDSGLSAPTAKTPNPYTFEKVEHCMQHCWDLGDECDAFSAINKGSDFAGKCFFRKGRLEMKYDYSSERRQDVGKCVEDGKKSMVQLPGCGTRRPLEATSCGTARDLNHKKECLYYFDKEKKECRACKEDDKETCLTPDMATENLLNCADPTNVGGEKKLPLCDDFTTLQNLNCTTDPHEAAPKIRPIEPPKVTQDDVFDDRDCYVKQRRA